MGLEKAKIMRIKQNDQVARLDAIEVMFNPKELTFARKINWSAGAAPKKDIPDYDFGGGEGDTLQMQLFFDTYAAGKDVRKEHTDKLLELTRVDRDLLDRENSQGRPPAVRFQWGMNVGFTAVITSFNQRFTLFLPNGTPVRAVVDVTFTQVADTKLFPMQNPTSGGEGGERVWTVREGDTLGWIAHREYDDATEWRRVADANRLIEVRRLTPGMRLMIPNA